MRALLPAALAILVVACENPAATTTDARPRLPTDPSILLSPAAGGSFTQNDPTIGCPAHPYRGYGFRVRFDWQDVPEASGYVIVFQHRGSPLSAISLRTQRSEYTETRCNAFVIDANRDQWIWSVYALATVRGDSTGAGRDSLLWSTWREYSFEPCRLADGRPCYAPPEDTTTS